MMWVVQTSLAWCLVLAFGMHVCAGIVESPQVAGVPTVAVTPVVAKEDKCTWGAHNGHMFTTQNVTMSTGTTTYGLLWTACTDKAHGERCSWVEGYLGMPAPTSCNWYHSGFLFLSVNGEDIGTYRPSYFGPADSGRRGAVDVCWAVPWGATRVRFVTLPQDDALFAEIRIEPSKPITSVHVRLACFPAEFTTWNKIRGDRTIATALRTEHQNPWDPATEKAPAARTVRLDSATDRWILYSDGVCDVARGQGAGPCGLLFLPSQIKTGTVTLTDYPIGTDLDADPGTTSLRLVFWDFKGQTNARALAYLREKAAGYAVLLEKLDFTSATVRDLLDDRREVELAKIAKDPAAPAAVARTAGDFVRKLEQALAHARAARQATGRVPQADESAILDLLRQEDAIADPLRWQLLFAE